MTMKIDDFDDYFDGPDIEEKPKEEVPPIEPDAILDKDADTIVVKRSRWRKTLLYAIAILLLGLTVGVYLRYFRPYVDDAQIIGYITTVERRGFIFKTYEGDMISEFAIHDTSKIYQRDFQFSFDNDSIAKIAMDLQGTGKKVKINYKQYQSVVPWRGSSCNIVTGVSSKK